MRSWLFVPADSERKLEKAPASGADVLIIDLEDSVALDNKPRGREIAAAFVAEKRDALDCRLYVRVNAFDTGMTANDLDAVIGAAPAGIVLPKAEGLAAAERLAAMLDELEPAHGIARQSTDILPIITETATGVLAAPTWNRPLPRLAGLTWGGEDLSADLGIAKPRKADGAYSDIFRHARTMTVLCAGASQTAAIDTVYVDFRNPDGLRAECKEAARDGFTGKLAIHPAQVDAINEAFTVTKEEIEEAQAVVDAFAAAGNPGVVGIGGKMYDRPHLRRAERTLARAASD